MSEKKHAQLSPGENFSDDDFEKAIRSCFDEADSLTQQRVKACLQIGLLCAQWASRSSRHEICKRLGMTPPELSKYISIGNDRRLQNERYLPHLPASYSILYEISQLDDDDFDAAIESNAIHPDVERMEIIALRGAGEENEEEVEEDEEDDDEEEEEEISGLPVSPPLVPDPPTPEENTAGESMKEQYGEGNAKRPVVHYVMPDVLEEQREAIIAEIRSTNFATFVLEPMPAAAKANKR